MSRPPRSSRTRKDASRYIPIFVIGPILWVTGALNAGDSLYAWVSVGVAIAVALSAVHLIAGAIRREHHAATRGRRPTPAGSSR